MRHVLPPHAALCDMHMCCHPMAPGATPRARVRATLVSVGFSLANTSFTSALGFLSLAFSPVPALGSFGAPTRLSTWHLGLQPPPPRPTASPQRLAAATACAPPATTGPVHAGILSALFILTDLLLTLTLWPCCVLLAEQPCSARSADRGAALRCVEDGNGDTSPGGESDTSPGGRASLSDRQALLPLPLARPSRCLPAPTKPRR